MTTQSPCDSIDPTILSELQQIRQEIAALNREIVSVTRYLQVIASAVSDIRGLEAQAAAAPTVVPAHASVNSQRCHACGAQVSRHPAEAGVLLLCPVCGWSEFIERDGHETSEVRPEQAPPGPRTNHWAA